MNSLPHVDSVHVTSLGHADERGWNGKGIISGNASRTGGQEIGKVRTTQKPPLHLLH